MYAIMGSERGTSSSLREEMAIPAKTTQNRLYRMLRFTCNLLKTKVLNISNNIFAALKNICIFTVLK